MKYKYTNNINYKEYATGRIIMSGAGMTSFPVRLASEIFQRCLNYRDNQNRVCVYDPCGGSAHLLTALGFLHSEHISSLFCSDIRQDATWLARNNLELLSEEGLMRRENTLCKMVSQYNKASHRDALDDITLLYKVLPSSKIITGVFVGNALMRTLTLSSVDILITDVPYGDVVAWQGNTGDPITRLLDVQHDVLKDNSIVAIITRKEQKIRHARYERLKHSTLGKRRISFLRPI